LNAACVPDRFDPAFCGEPGDVVLDVRVGVDAGVSFDDPGARCHVSLLFGFPWTKKYADRSGSVNERPEGAALFMCRARRWRPAGCGRKNVLYAEHSALSPGLPVGRQGDAVLGGSPVAKGEHVALSAGARKGVALGLAEAPQAGIGA